MHIRLRQWQEASDDRAFFLNCYLLMTRNMYVAIQQREFVDSAWVSRLLTHFAEYYFSALQKYEDNSAATPEVWRHAFDKTRDPYLTPLQKLLLGVNAHINYDLVLTLVDILRPEWENLTDIQRVWRYADHYHVNEIIGRTIDTVQDRVLEPAMPILELIDRVLGNIDENLIIHLITRWRESVWLNTLHLLEADPIKVKHELIRGVESEALQNAELICGIARPPAQKGGSTAAEPGHK